MMTSYGNCTDDVLWTLETIGGCASGDTGGLGVVFGVVCIPLWTFSQLALYLIYCQPDGKASKTGTSHVTCIVVFHWVADVLSLFGCIMTHQLPLQTYYALTSASVHFLAIVPAMLSSRRTRRSDKDMGETTFNCKCLRHCYMTQSSCTAAMSILSVVSLVTVTMLQTPWYKSAVKRHDTPSNGGNIHSQTDEEGDLGNSYAVFPSTNTAMTYSTDGKRQMFEYTYCDSPADTSSEQDLEWDFECPVVHRDDRPLTSSLKYARMTMGSLKSISSLESDSGYEKVVDWFKRS